MTFDNGIDLDLYVKPCRRPKSQRSWVCIVCEIALGMYTQGACLDNSCCHLSLTFGSAVRQLEKGCSKVSNGCHKM